MNINPIIENISILYIISSILLFFDMNYNYISLILKIIFIISGMNIIYSTNYKMYIFNYIMCLVLLFITLITNYYIFQLFSLILNAMSIKLIIPYKNI